MTQLFKFYQVVYRTEHGSSAGYSWHTSRTEAKKSANAAVKDDPDEYKDEPPAIHEITVLPTKRGILSTLRLFASEPTNG